VKKQIVWRKVGEELSPEYTVPRV
ncbi:unnamed protein product, partial [Rotaria sp. Silwood1]